MIGRSRDASGARADRPDTEAKGDAALAGKGRGPAGASNPVSPELLRELLRLRVRTKRLVTDQLSGAYSSIFIAAPLLAVYKAREPRYAATKNLLHLGDEMQRLMGTGREETKRIAAEPVDGVARATSALTHPPRPRKNKRR